MITPIVVICHNNYKYVQNTLQQIRLLNEEYYKNIIIMDNNSDDETKLFLKNIENEGIIKIFYNKTNDGPWISSSHNQHIYKLMPDKFIITDPDLQFNSKLSKNFIEELITLSDKYQCRKIGFAIDISDFDKMYNTIYYNHSNIYDHERVFWINKIHEENHYELYKAPIDTTFCLINNLVPEYVDLQIRVAGNFTCKHLPWYRQNPIYSTSELYSTYNKCSRTISTTSKIILSDIQENFHKVNKNDQLFFFPKKENYNDENLSFWLYTYSDWEKDTFSVFDKFLNKDKIFIDIGGWIGTTCIYASRKSKHVYCVEADEKSIIDMKKNITNNCIKYPPSITIIQKAIYNIDNIKLKFGKNKFLQNSKMNDSTSQIYEDNEISSEYNEVSTITFKSIIEKYNILTNEISLIKVDIEGGEENILQDLFEYHKLYNIPLYVSFHYSWWKDQNLNRFSFLSESTKQKIQNFPFCSILFDSQNLIIYS